MLPEDEEAAVTLEHQCAVAIQAIARGRLARHAVERRRQIFTRAAIVIQAGARCLFARRYVAVVRRRHHAALTIQRVERGRQARVRTYARRQRLRRRRASIKIQASIARGVKGRVRMHAKRQLVTASACAREAAYALFPTHLEELAEVKYVRYSYKALRDTHAPRFILTTHTVHFPSLANQLGACPGPSGVSPGFSARRG